MMIEHDRGTGARWGELAAAFEIRIS